MKKIKKFVVFLFGVLLISKILDLLIQDEKISAVSREEYRNLILLNSPELVQTDIPFEEFEKRERTPDERTGKGRENASHYFATLHQLPYWPLQSR